MNTTAENQTILDGLRRERARLIRKKAGPADNGYTSTFVEPLEESADNLVGFMRREQIRAKRLQALRSGG